MNNQNSTSNSEVSQKEQNQIILYRPNDTISLEVRLENETVWLSQAQIAELFERDRTVIGKHIKNCYKEGELDQNITCAKFAHMGTEGDQTYEYTMYNLDVIISVGYRVKSIRGTQFRQWANKVLKEYLLRGYAVNQRINILEDKIDRKLAEQDVKIENLNKQVDFFVRTSLPPVEGVFCNGQIFDAYKFATDLIKSANKSLVLVDNYVDESVLLMLSKRKTGVSAKIYTSHLGAALQLDLQRHNTQFPPIEIELHTTAHDRFLIIDDAEVYHIGASLKDLGKKLFAFSKLNIPPSAIL
ncbi:MAG: virulence RhuM family protein [Paludibacteraceae bacterium]|nr:virulence RhuM family protein [Paludibacteraceae bacterium]